MEVEAHSPVSSPHQSVWQMSPGSTTGAGRKRSRSVASDTTSNSSDTSMDDAISVSPRHSRRRRRTTGTSPTGTLASSPTRLTAWSTSMLVQDASAPRAPPASPTITSVDHTHDVLDPPMDDDAPMFPVRCSASAEPPLTIQSRSVSLEPVGSPGELPDLGTTSAARFISSASFAPTTPSPLALSRLSMEDMDAATIDPEDACTEGLGPPRRPEPLPRVQGARHTPAGGNEGHTGAESGGTNSRSHAIRRYSPGVRSADPPGGRPLLRYTMGYREDCELCRQRTPGHYNHIMR